MKPVKAFIDRKDNIPAFCSPKSQNNAVLISHGNSHHTLSGCLIPVRIEIRNDLFLQIILVLRLYNSVFISSLQVDINIIASYLNRSGLFPVDLIYRISVFILLSHGVSKFFHHAQIQAAILTQDRRNIFSHKKSMIRYNKKS